MPESVAGSDTVMVALDGSLPAQVAAHAAIQIAASQGLQIHGLYVVDEPLIMTPYANYQKELSGAAELVSRPELVTRFEAQGTIALLWLEAQCQEARVPVTNRLLLGGVPEAVLQEAGAAGLLALGRRGHGHAGDVAHLGSNFRAIAHRARQPVLVGGEERRAFKRLLLAYDESEPAQHALAWATRLHRSLPAEALVVIVQEKPGPVLPWLSDLQAQLDRSGLTDYRLLLREGDPASEIVATATENQVDGILLGAYRQPVLLEWLTGSIQDEVLRRTQLPVLLA